MRAKGSADSLRNGRTFLPAISASRYPPKAQAKARAKSTGLSVPARETVGPAQEACRRRLVFWPPKLLLLDIFSFSLY